MGAKPDAGREYSKNREREIWDSFEKVIDICGREKTELLLIAGDLFHRQPLLRELKEVDHLFRKIPGTQVVLSAGNHDYLKKDSYYRTFHWADHVHMILSEQITCIELPQIRTAVYGFSYTGRENQMQPYAGADAMHRQPFEILMVHGGDEKHVPVRKEELRALGYDYTALGHIHKPQELYPDTMFYAGALEPIDKNDTGSHGFVKGEITSNGVRAQFVPMASREYKHESIEVTGDMTGYAVKDKINAMMEEKGIQNIYKILLKGFRDADILFDLNQMDTHGNIVEIIDETHPAYELEKLKRQNKDNILGLLIEEWGDADRDSLEYKALCEGIRALLETRRG